MGSGTDRSGNGMKAVMQKKIRCVRIRYDFIFANKQICFFAYPKLNRQFWLPVGDSGSLPEMATSEMPSQTQFSHDSKMFTFEYEYHNDIVE